MKSVFPLIALSLLLPLSAVRAADEPTKAPTVVLPPRKSPPYIILKIDDMTSAKGKVHPLWKRFVNFTKERNIKASIGIIANSLEGDVPEYFQFIKDLHASGQIEFWQHGYDHAQWKEGDKTLEEFSGSTYEHQKEDMTKANKLAREKLGFPFETFGAPFNATDANTVKVLSEDKDIKIWLYGDLKHPAGKIVLDRVGAVNIENPTFVPSLEKFIAGYAKYPNRDVFVIQGHTTHWDDARWAEFVKIIDFLTEQKAIFTTPSEYVKIKNLTPPAGN
jgi:peptidoglycan/xylan/chitin deacetylase (PgdA/CDA1 family)